MLTSDQLYAVAGCATVAGGAVGWLAGHLRTTRRYERDGGLMDEAEQEGYDHACDDYGLSTTGRSAATSALPAEDATSAAPDAITGEIVPSVMTAAIGTTTDFLHPDFEQLDPARLDAANQDLPGRESMPAPPAGEHHMDAPLPTVLSLGTEYDGGPQTAALVAWRLWDMTARYEQERARFRAECGLGIAA